jgi:hypothetical protein
VNPDHQRDPQHNFYQRSGAICNARLHNVVLEHFSNGHLFLSSACTMAGVLSFSYGRDCQEYSQLSEAGQDIFPS